MIKNFFGFKEKTIQAFDKKGRRLPVTKVQVFPLVIKRIKTKEKDGYLALLMSFKKKKKEILKEVRVDKLEDFKVGEKITPDKVFSVDDKVKVRGISKGKGFTGVVKRWGFKGGPATHGQSDRERAPGAIGQGTDPGRVWKGKRMAGRAGGKTVFIKGLKVFKVDKEKNEIWVTGLIPGVKGGMIEISKIK